MFHELVPAKRMTFWGIVSMVPLLSCFAAGMPWLTVLAAGLVYGSLSWGVCRFCTQTDGTHFWLNGLQWLWLGVFLGNVIPSSTLCWENEKAVWVIPMAILVLAAFSAQSGGARASRAAAVLSWLVLPVVVLVLAAGVQHLEPKWMTPRWQMPSGMLVLIFLIPCVTAFVPVEGKRPSGILPMAALVVGVVLAFWVGSSLSPAIASRSAEPLYWYCKGISLFGVTERFESALSCTLTAGWFALGSLVFSAAGNLSERIRKGWGRKGVWACFAVACIVSLCKMYVQPRILAVMTLIFWVLLPLLTQLVDGRKKSKKGQDLP